MGNRSCLVFLTVLLIIALVIAVPVSAANYTFVHAGRVPAITSPPGTDHTALFREIMAGDPGLSASAFPGAAGVGRAAPYSAILAIPEPTVSAGIGPSDSIQAAVFAAADGDTLWLDPGTYREHDIVIDRNITIRANTSIGGNRDNTIIDAEHAGRVFNVTGPFTFAIDNLGLHNGTVSSTGLYGEGGAILAKYPESTLIIVSSGFSNCQVITLAGATGYGGAIAADGALSITGSLYANCSVTGTGGQNYGGAVYSGSAGAVIASSTFTNCSVSGNSGGMGGAVAGASSITDSTFENCSASGNVAAGGAVEYAESITGCTFINCSVTTDVGASLGGAVMYGLTVTDSVFTRCSANGIYNVMGGAIWGSRRVTGSVFSNCSANGSGDSVSGGAISSGWTVDSIPAIDRSTFTDCSVSSGGSAGGGAVAGFTNITGSTFTRCSAAGSDLVIGGATYGGESISGSTFTDCSVSNGMASYGGAVSLITNITGSTFTRCSADGSDEAGGGAVYGADRITGSTFTGCSVSAPTTSNGGAVFAAGSVTSSSFSYCTATDSGGAILGAGTVASSTFANCYAAIDGGAILDSYDVISCRFVNCEAGMKGGGIMYVDNTTGSTFENCRALDGGALYFPPVMAGTTGTIASSAFTGCSARNNGGAVFTESVDLLIDNSTVFSGSTADQYGGTLYINGGNVVMDSVSIRNSRAGSGGGAIALTHTGSLDAESCTFESCSAPDGGALLSGAPATIHFSRFWQNTATGTGPAIRTVGGTVHAENNWWGTNSDPSPLVYGNVITAPWLVLGITADPISITAPQTSSVRTNLTYNSDGTNTAGGGIYLPDAIPNMYAVESGPGSVAPVSAGSASGRAQTTYISLQPGTATIAGTVDGQTVYVTLDVAQGSWTPSPTEVPNDDDWPQVGGGVPAGGGGGSAAATGSTGFPLMTVTVNIGGDSKAGQAIVTGTKLSDLIVTGTVQSSGAGGNFTVPPGIVFQYISLVPARFNTITNAVINFTVPQSWLEENHIDPGSVVLYRFTANGWEALPTTVLYTKDGTVYFSAVSPGFSLFAIAGTLAVLTPPGVAATQEPVSTSAEQEQAPAPAAVAKAPVTTRTTAPSVPVQVPAKSSPFPLVPVVAVICCIGLIGGGWYLRRWWIRRQNPALFADDD